MPDFHSQIYSLALDAFLLIGAAKLTIELLIPLVMLVKKLGATIKSDYVLESERREKSSRDATKLLIAQLQRLNAFDQVEVIRAVWPELAGGATQSQTTLDPSVWSEKHGLGYPNIWPEVKARLERASHQ
jgi:hypothetical protein